MGYINLASRRRILIVNEENKILDQLCGSPEEVGDLGPAGFTILQDIAVESKPHGLRDFLLSKMKTSTEDWQLMV